MRAPIIIRDNPPEVRVLRATERQAIPRVNGATHCACICCRTHQCECSGDCDHAEGVSRPHQSKSHSVTEPDRTPSQLLIAALDHILDLGHGELLLHRVPRAQLIAWAGLHRLAVVCSEDIATRITQVMHRDGAVLAISWEYQ